LALLFDAARWQCMYNYAVRVAASRKLMKVATASWFQWPWNRRARLRVCTPELATIYTNHN